MDLIGKHIVIGVTGGIAAYKAAELVRRCRALGAEVRVMMTDNAAQFVTPLTFQALSGERVHTAVCDAEAEYGMGHIELARWADGILIAPASANTLARLAQGMASDVVSTVCLATRAAVYVAPAMNQQMWQHPATQANCRKLVSLGYTVWPPASGEQACGEVGPGRLPEVDVLLAKLQQALRPQQMTALVGKQVVITVGPTHEPFDAVRYIGNHSSGKMGFALASALHQAGANVHIISGPVTQTPPVEIANTSVTDARDMLRAVLEHLPGCDLFIATAAVADYRPETCTKTKIKKSRDPLSLKLVPNPDILAMVAARMDAPFTVGFAAETTEVIAQAQAKRIAKQVDMIIANDVSEPGIGFAAEDNAVTIITERATHPVARASKRQIATTLVEHIAREYENSHSSETIR